MYTAAENTAYLTARLRFAQASRALAKAAADYRRAKGELDAIERPRVEARLAAEAKARQ